MQLPGIPPWMPDPRMQTNDMIENPHVPPAMDQRDRTYDPSHVMSRRDGGLFGSGTVHDEHGGQSPPAPPFQIMGPDQKSDAPFGGGGEGRYPMGDEQRAIVEHYRRILGGQGQTTDQDMPFMRMGPME